MIKKLKKKKVYARFKDTIWAADLAGIRSLPSFDSFVKHLLCLIDVFTKNAWVESFNDKKAKTVLHGFLE